MPIPVIVDAHQDIAFNKFALGRDLQESVSEKRRRESPEPPAWGGKALVGLPELMAANVRIVFGTLFVAPSTGDGKSPYKKYSSPEEASEQAKEQLDYYSSLEHDPRISLITTRARLENVLQATEPRLGIVVLMEGADPIVTPADVCKWYDGGVRIVGTSWGRTRYAGGTGAPGGLTPLGRELMSEMDRVGMALDVSHMAEESFYQAIDLFRGRVIASHSNCRAIVDGDRHLSDDMIRALVKRDGVIGTVFYNRFLRANWDQSTQKDQVGLEDVVRQIQHICGIAGDAQHVGLGSDFDGGFGAEASPREIDTVADLGRMGGLLAKSFAPADVANILGLNWVRLLRDILP